MADPMDLTERSELFRWLSVQLLVTLAQSLVLAVLVRSIVNSYGRNVSLAATAAVALVAVGTIRLQRLALPGTGAKRRRRLAAAAKRGGGLPGSDAVSAVLGRPGLEPVAPLPETLDRRFRRLARHADRLTYAVVEPRHFHSGVRPVLAELAADGLRRHHGFDLELDRDRAREVLGDDLWQALTSDRATPPTPGDLDRWLSALELLGEETSTPTARLRST